VRARREVRFSSVLVTGAGSGIGREAAVRIAATGASLTLAGRREEPLTGTARLCRDAGAAGVLVHPVDVTDAEGVEALVAAAQQAHGPLDACVHAAGLAAYGRLEELPLPAADRVLEVNLLGALRVARPVLRAFRATGHGSLVLVGSVLGRVVVPEMGAYVVSKWAVRALARVLQVETRDAPGVHVSLVSPGAVDTPIYPEAANWTGRSPRPPWPVARADDTAAAVVAVLQRPRRERLTGWASPVMVLGGALAPVYDRLVAPAMSALGFSGAAPRGWGNLWRDGRETLQG